MTKLNPPGFDRSSQLHGTQSYLDDLFHSRLIRADFAFEYPWDTFTDPRYKCELGPFAKFVSSLDADKPVGAITLCWEKSWYFYFVGGNWRPQPTALQLSL